MNVLISGGSGLIGTELAAALTKRGHSVTILTRNKDNKTAEQGIRFAEWTPSKLEIDQQAIDASDVVINLAGASIAQRWTSAAKKAIVNSRVNSTQTLVKALEKSTPKTLINASAIGIYPFGDDEKNENSPAGEGFMQDVVKQWEAEGQKAIDHRVVFIRIGVVLSAKGGALDRLLPIFKMGLGSAVGSGEQWMSWIHIDDLVRLFVHVAEHEHISGVINGVAPNPVTNLEFSQQLAQSLNKPFWFPKVPAFALKILFGEMSQVILRSQKILSVRQDEIAFELKYNKVDNAFNHLFS